MLSKEENRTETFLLLLFEINILQYSTLRHINIARASVKNRKREKKKNTQNISTTPPELRWELISAACETNTQQTLMMQHTRMPRLFIFPKSPENN